MAKEDIPFELLEFLDPVIKKQKEKVTFSYFLNDKNEIQIKSSFFSDKFYFTINYKPNSTSQTTEGTKNVYTISYYPATENTLRIAGTNKTAKNIVSELNNWFAILDKYENTKTFLDDPLIESYQKDIFENTLKFIPEKDYEKPYPLESQINFIEYLDTLEVLIKKEISTTKDQEDKSNLKQSLNLIIDIKDNINKLAKGDVKNKFSLALAHIAKASLKFFKIISTEIIKEIAVKALIGN